MLRKLRRQLRDINLQRPPLQEKIFYVSLQRCGTKSFSQFFRSNGFKTASWDISAENNWPLASLEGQYHQITNSRAFRRNQVFDDGPWHHLPLVKYLYWAVPRSRFVFFSRPFEDWLKSMKSHSGGQVLGNPKRHCMVYNRLPEYYEALDKGLDPTMQIDTAEEIYARAFENHTLQVRAFFEDKPSERFFQAELYDPDKFQKLGAAWSVNFSDPSDVHVHRSGHPAHRDFARDKTD